jgi:hypothetical protein
MKLQKICDGVYWTDEEGPHRKKIDGEDYIRFMDHFYLASKPENLSQEQVTKLCRKRAEHLDQLATTNSEVRELFRCFIEQLRPSNILEIGCGTNPLLDQRDLPSYTASYIRADSDPSCTDTGDEFSGHRPRLNLPDEHIHFAIAIFVLHFKFHETQIRELHRCLAGNGIFIANLYLRAKDSRRQLKHEFNTAGFLVNSIPDRKNLCRNHEFLIIAKNPDPLQTASEIFTRVLGQ